MLRIKNNPTLKGLSEFIPGIVYSRASGKDITLDMIHPQVPGDNYKASFPLVVFIQGSAWHFPDTGYEIPQLSAISQAGYVVASVTHRNIDDGYPAPAYLQDVKTAIRFLRTNAEHYNIDPLRVYAFGTSSGGNTALLLGLTGDMEEFRTEEYNNVSDSVNAVIDCFGPTDLTEYVPKQISLMSEENKKLFQAFCGGSFDMDLLKKMSPINYVTKEKTYVPFLIAHGDKDQLVDFSQSVRMAELLEKCGANVSFIRVEGAEHEGTFWSENIWNIILHFLDDQSALQ